MIKQYYAQRSRPMFPAIPQTVRGITTYIPDPRDRRRIGTIPVGTIVYIQDGISPFGFRGPIVCREPWQVEAWLTGEHTRYDATIQRFRSVAVAAGGHLAQVRSLRDSRRVSVVADWILLQCLDAGLEDFKGFGALTSKRRILRRLKEPGTTLTLLSHDWHCSPQWLGTPRRVLKVTRNSAKLDNGFWLRLPASGYCRQTDDGFEVCLRKDGSFGRLAAYQIRSNPVSR